MRGIGTRELLLTTLLLAIPGEAHKGAEIFSRQNTCPDPAFSQCSNTKLPLNFCCPNTSACIELAASTTLLCCPKNSNCSAIQPLTCDISQQNATLHPSNILKTTALNIPLLKCGAGCCPFGFSCNGTVCQQNTKQDAPPSANPTSTLVSIVPTAGASSVSSPVTVSCNKFPVPAVLAGFFPGIALGVILTIASVCLLGAHRRARGRRSSDTSFGNISEPQPVAQDMRTDFLRKPPMTPSSTAATSTRSKSVRRVRSLFRKSNATTVRSSGMTESLPGAQRNMTGGVGGGMASAGGANRTREPPVTPRLQREPSYENINIFADGSTAASLRQHTPPVPHTRTPPPRDLLLPRGLGGEQRGSHQTTFTDMMESSGLAGLQKGQPYVYKGQQSPPAGVPAALRPGAWRDV